MAMALVHLLHARARVEANAREQKMVVVQASDMANAISTTGRVALYGIHFDTIEAEIKPESEATLARMAKLLKDTLHCASSSWATPTTSAASARTWIYRSEEQRP